MTDAEKKQMKEEMIRSKMGSAPINDESTHGTDKATIKKKKNDDTPMKPGSKKAKAVDQAKSTVDKVNPGPNNKD